MTADIKNKLQGCRVMVVDDDEDVRELMKFHLKKLECESILVSNGEEAIHHYQHSLNTESAIDVAILDLSLRGGIGGVDIADKIRAIDPQAKLVVFSGNTECDEMRDFQRFGFVAALEKIFKHDTIKNTLLEVMS